MGRFIDLTGQKFDHLTVINRGETHRQPNGKTTIYWICECDCKDKTIVSVRGDSLKNGSIRSCGCLQKEIVSQISKGNKHKKKYNTYDLSGEYGIGYTTKGEEFYFDLEDYDKIKDYCWHIDPKGYVVCASSNGKRVTLYFQRVLFPDLPNHNIIQVDHIRGRNTRNDNRKANLRICTVSQNSMNIGLRTDNTSGVTGVYWYKPQNKWVVKICVNQKDIHIGYFDKFDDAVKARKEAEDKYFGKFSYDNSMREING